MNGSTVNKDLMERAWRVARKGTISYTIGFNNFNKNNYIFYFSSFTKKSNSFHLRKMPTVAIIDSGASWHYGTLSLDCIDKLSCNENIHVSLPNNIIISPTHTTYLSLPNFLNIPRAALKVYLIPDAYDEVLISFSQFFDHGYKLILIVKMCLYLIKIKEFWKVTEQRLIACSLSF